jgi:RNA polymerase sigma-70 factor (ECF subfamily)
MIDPAQFAVLQHRLAVFDDQQAFIKLFRHFQPALKKFAYSICQNREDAEEIVEDVFIRIWMKRRTLDQVQNLKLYLYLATRNFSLNYCRNKHNTTQLNIDEMKIEFQSLLPDPQQQLLSLEIQEQIGKAIEELPHKCKVIFKLVKEDGLKQKDVAELLHLSLKTVENQLAIAVKRIALAIGKTRITKQSKPQNTGQDIPDPNVFKNY